MEFLCDMWQRLVGWWQWCWIPKIELQPLNPREKIHDTAKLNRIIYYYKQA